jgi:Type II secretion system (T2SS), protein F
MAVAALSSWLVAGGLLAGLGCWLIISELIPTGPNLRAAIERLDSAGGRVDSHAPFPGRLGRHLTAIAPWLPVPVTDLRILGQDPTAWMASKIGYAAVGLVLGPAVSALATLGGHELPSAIPVGASLALGLVLSFVPDLVTRVNAKQKRTDFRHALASYVDLVALERSGGAGPTEALEAAAEVGRGWAFERIRAVLDQARKASQPPWQGLARLAAEIGISELADLAEIAEVAGQEGARILQTLGARADSMRAQALAETKAQAGARSTTMVLPIALLAGGFLVLLIFPDFYRLFG